VIHAVASARFAMAWLLRLVSGKEGVRGEFELFSANSKTFSMFLYMNVTPTVKSVNPILMATAPRTGIHGFKGMNAAPSGDAIISATRMAAYIREKAAVLCHDLVSLRSYCVMGLYISHLWCGRHASAMIAWHRETTVVGPPPTMVNIPENHTALRGKTCGNAQTIVVQISLSRTPHRARLRTLPRPMRSARALYGIDSTRPVPDLFQHECATKK
jgi:hypothetical protein